MKWRQVATIVGLAASLAIVLQAQQGGGRTGGAAPAGTGGALIGGTLAPARPDARGWGCQVKASTNAATPRPFYNKAKELLFQDKQITNYTIAACIPEFYCEVAKHCDCIWFEMQHSTMSYDEVCRMIFRFGKTRVDVGVDVENLFNTSYPTTYENTYQYSVGNTAMGGTWDNPTAIYSPRFARLNFTVSF